MSYKVQWQSEQDASTFYLVIGESTKKSNEELRHITYWLIIGFGGISIILVLGQYLVLRQAFKPINTLEKEIVSLENGNIEHLSQDYPEELCGVERNINALIEKERRQRERYRESMANLAHSLKTPITVIAAEISNYPENKILRNAINNINNSIEYQLRRAVISGHTLVSSGVKINKVVELILEAILKIHTDKNINIEKKIDTNAMFFGDENDLMEIFGNLIDNAFKHAKSKINVTAAIDVSGLHLSVEDDGPGLNGEDTSRIFKRGERLDQRNAGQGIGLSIVDDIVSSYEGKISVSRSSLGGAIFNIWFRNRE